MLVILITAFGIPSIVFGRAPQDHRTDIQLSYSQRMRIEMWDNTIGLSKSSGSGSSYFRNRSSLALTYNSLIDVALSVKLTNELRYYAVPESRGFEFDELFIDLLFFKWNNVLRFPVSVTLGRQNMSFGEGFVVMDGGPLDGSRSAYFNAARLDWNLSSKSRMSVFYFFQPERDQYLPILNNLKKKLIEHHEEGFGIHYSVSMATGEVQGYLIRKSARSSDLQNRSARMLTSGIRVNYTILPALSLSAETAYQLGEWNTDPMRAYGGYIYGEYSPEMKPYLPKKVTLGGIYLSGDDQETEAHEGWDPLFSRWPKWSESYIYALAPEQGPAYWSNFASVYARFAFDITSDVMVTVDYHHLMAPERAPSGALFPGGTGRTRGELVVGKLSYKLYDYLTGHVIVEHFTPGNYYFDGADSYAWIRLETLLNF